ncbi:MAG TPA: DUF1761 domain-containing protein [Thermoanaerobaculia bacterium]
MEQNLASLNWIAVFLSALSTFVLGGLWYSPLLFAKMWQREANLSDEQLQAGNQAVIFAWAFLLALISAFVLALFIGDHGLPFGLTAGVAVGLGWVATSLGITFLFERRSARLTLIDAGYHVVAFTLMGTIISAFN